MIKLSDTNIELDYYPNKRMDDYILIDDDLRKFRLYMVITRYSGKKATPRLVYADYVRIIMFINNISSTISLYRVKDKDLPKLCKVEMPNVIRDIRILEYNRFLSDPKEAWRYFLNDRRNTIDNHKEVIEYNERLFRLGKREAAKVGYDPKEL
jgi:hypothetical protein